MNESPDTNYFHKKYNFLFASVFAHISAAPCNPHALAKIT